MTYPERPINGIPNPWLFSQRPTRGAQLVGACIHATRSGVPAGDDGPRTERWMMNTNNGSAQQGWGGSCDLIIFEDGTRVIVNPNIKTFEPTYSAGFGLTAFTWSCGWYYIQIEMAQGVLADEYTFAQIDSLAEYLVAEGVEPVRIPWLAQTLGSTPPVGICTHEDSENGKKLGKSDPGPMFPWRLLFERMAAWSGSSQSEKELGMVLFQAGASIYIICACGKRGLGDQAEVDAYIQAGVPLKAVTAAVVAGIPDVPTGGGGIPLNTAVKVVKA